MRKAVCMILMAVLALTAAAALITGCSTRRYDGPEKSEKPATARRVFIRKFCIKNDLGICLNGLANKEYRIAGIIEQSGILSWGEAHYETSPFWILLRFLVITRAGSFAYFQSFFCGVQISICSAFAQDGILGCSSVIRIIICSI